MMMLPLPKFAPEKLAPGRSAPEKLYTTCCAVTASDTVHDLLSGQRQRHRGCGQRPPRRGSRTARGRCRRPSAVRQLGARGRHRRGAPWWRRQPLQRHDRHPFLENLVGREAPRLVIIWARHLIQAERVPRLRVARIVAEAVQCFFGEERH
ncbi:hypothetical protein M885DRAFT_548562 [Pelagophyceae sp. CCMP2097]|nr:hypothetical protein M885DRAFT_548562 [Pelagophyceae sp. CCMP2097]